MIYDTLEHLKQYKGIHPNLDTAIDAILEKGADSFPEGRTDIDGDRVFVNVTRPALMPEDEAPWESHARYADLQIGLEDGETICCAPIADVTGFGPRTPGDLALSRDPVKGIPLPLKKGIFAVLFPSDAHKPLVGEGHGHKFVCKVLVD